MQDVPIPPDEIQDPFEKNESGKDAAPEIPQLIQVVGRRWSISAAPAVTRAEASVLVVIGAAEALAAADLTALEQACSGSAMS